MRRPVLGIFATASVALLSVAPVVLVASSAEAATSTSCVQAAINDVSHPEGNASTTDFDFTVTVTFPPGCNNTAGEAVDYATADGTATAPTDYSSTSGTLTWAPGETTAKHVHVTVIGDLTPEPDETFSVNLSNNQHVTIARGQGTGTIVNDDGPPPSQPNISINDVSHPEGNSGTTTFSFTVSLSAPSTQTVTVDYATADGSAMAPEDYASTSGTLTFLPSVTSQMVNVSVNGDAAGHGVRRQRRVALGGHDA